MSTPEVLQEWDEIDPRNRCPFCGVLLIPTLSLQVEHCPRCGTNWGVRGYRAVRAMLGRAEGAAGREG